MGDYLTYPYLLSTSGISTSLNSSSYKRNDIKISKKTFTIKLRKLPYRNWLTVS